MKQNKLGIVVFFKRNQNGTYDSMGQTKPLRYFTALEVYANTPNPASQLVEGFSVEDVLNSAKEIVQKMACRDYVEEYVDPYL